MGGGEDKGHWQMDNCLEGFFARSSSLSVVFLPAPFASSPEEEVAV